MGIRRPVLDVNAACSITELPDGSRPVDKNISVYRNDNSVYGPLVSPGTRGASRSSRTWVEMRWTPIAQLTSVHEADGEVVWS